MSEKQPLPSRAHWWTLHTLSQKLVIYFLAAVCALLIATLESLGRKPEAAAIRAEPGESADKTPPPNLQDGNGLARMARVSRELDRTLLRPGGEAPDGQAPAGKGPRKIGSGGARQ